VFAVLASSLGVPAAFLLAVPTLLAATAASFAQLLFWRFLQGVFLHDSLCCCWSPWRG